MKAVSLIIGGPRLTRLGFSIFHYGRLPGDVRQFVTQLALAFPRYSVLRNSCFSTSCHEDHIDFRDVQQVLCLLCFRLRKISCQPLGH